MKDMIDAYVEEHGEDKAASNYLFRMSDFIVEAIFELDEDSCPTAQNLHDYIQKVCHYWFPDENFNKSLEQLLEEEKLVLYGFIMLSDDFEAEKLAEMEELKQDLYKGEHLVSVDKIELINLLVECFPEARKLRNGAGKLPFQCFLQNKAQNRFDNVALFMTEEAAMVPEKESGLCGFMSAASIGDIDLSYRMLRAFPSVIGQYVGEQ